MAVAVFDGLFGLRFFFGGFVFGPAFALLGAAFASTSLVYATSKGSVSGQLPISLLPFLCTHSTVQTTRLALVIDIRKRCGRERLVRIIPLIPVGFILFLPRHSLRGPVDDYTTLLDRVLQWYFTLRWLMRLWSQSIQFPVVQ